MKVFLRMLDIHIITNVMFCGFLSTQLKFCEAWSTLRHYLIGAWSRGGDVFRSGCGHFHEISNVQPAQVIILEMWHGFGYIISSKVRSFGRFCGGPVGLWPIWEGSAFWSASTASSNRLKKHQGFPIQVKCNRISLTIAVLHGRISTQPGNKSPTNDR